MRIIISGVGDVGFHLARQLSKDGHHITVIDRDAEHLARVDATAEVLTVHGSSTSLKTLGEAGAQNADLMLAVTSVEDVNIITTILSKRMGTRQTLARVSSAEYVASDVPINLDEIGIDHLIYPEELAAHEIVKLIERAGATDIHEFENGKLTLIGLKLDRKATIIHRTIQEVMLDLTGHDFRIVLVKRGGDTHIPGRDEKLIPGDQIVVMTKPEGLKLILQLTGKEKAKFNNILILGGGKIGRTCARLMQDHFNVKLIETDMGKALELADQLKNTLVINGDGRDMDLLAEEGIGDMDAFVAVTEDAETNIISSLMARTLGVTKTLAYVENAEYSQLTQAIGIDSLINKKLIAANVIARLARKARVVAIHNIHGMDAEVLEYDVPPGSHVTKMPLRHLRFPRGAIIGGIVRGEETFIATGDSQIQEGDKVVVFALPGCIDTVEEMFRK